MKNKKKERIIRKIKTTQLMDKQDCSVCKYFSECKGRWKDKYDDECDLFDKDIYDIIEDGRYDFRAEFFEYLTEEEVIEE